MEIKKFKISSKNINLNNEYVFANDKKSAENIVRSLYGSEPKVEQCLTNLTK